MKSRFCISILAVILAVLPAAGGCSRDGGAPYKPGAEQAQKGGHAPANVKPGSHEDWCEEHRVPESQCTRCNAELVPAFKATGDWCVEHQVPESQCLKCNPKLSIVRPPKGR